MSGVLALSLMAVFTGLVVGFDVLVLRGMRFGIRTMAVAMRTGEIRIILRYSFRPLRAAWKTQRAGFAAIFLLYLLWTIALAFGGLVATYALLQRFAAFM
jgi:hypothetical protein